MAKTKKDEVVLTATQLTHLIEASIRNLGSLQVTESKNGYKFLLMPEPLVEGECVSTEQEPENPEDILDLAMCHGVLELYNFLEDVGSMKSEKDEFFRFFNTVEINSNNIGAFVRSLAEIDEIWAETDLQAEQEEDLKSKIEGKNFVAGNDTVN